jgi:hypothetical protein
VGKGILQIIAPGSENATLGDTAETMRANAAPVGRLARLLYADDKMR